MSFLGPKRAISVPKNKFAIADVIYLKLSLMEYGPYSNSSALGTATIKSLLGLLPNPMAVNIIKKQHPTIIHA